MPIDVRYARIELYNINENCRFLLRTRQNTTKSSYDPLNRDALLTVLFNINMFIIFVFTWPVHFGKKFVH